MLWLHVCVCAVLWLLSLCLTSMTYIYKEHACLPLALGANDNKRGDGPKGLPVAAGGLEGAPLQLGASASPLTPLCLLLLASTTCTFTLPLARACEILLELHF